MLFEYGEPENGARYGAVKLNGEQVFPNKMVIEAEAGCHTQVTLTFMAFNEQIRAAIASGKITVINQEPAIKNEQLMNALRLVQKAAGMPDPAEACRTIIKIASQATEPE